MISKIALLENQATLEYINSLQEIDVFEFNDYGWYFFISKITGLLTIVPYHQQSHTFYRANSSTHYKDMALYTIIRLPNDNNSLSYHFELYKYFSDCFERLIELQIKLTSLIIHSSKNIISNEGLYDLKVVKRTCNYVNYNKHFGTRFFYLFNAIDKRLLDLSFFYINNRIKIDDFINGLFWKIDYNLHGFMIWNHYFPDNTKELHVSKIYSVDIKRQNFSKIQVLKPVGIYIDKKYVELSRLDKF